MLEHGESLESISTPPVSTGEKWKREIVSAAAYFGGLNSNLWLAVNRHGPTLPPTQPMLSPFWLHLADKITTVTRSISYIVFRFFYIKKQFNQYSIEILHYITLHFIIIIIIIKPLAFYLYLTLIYFNLFFIKLYQSYNSNFEFCRLVMLTQIIFFINFLKNFNFILGIEFYNFFYFLSIILSRSQVLRVN
jgi:hypothetical protein